MGYEKNGLSSLLEFLELPVAFGLKENVSDRQRLVYDQDLRINVDRNGKASRTNIPLE